jgi:MoxR-like ATPase
MNPPSPDSPDLDTASSQYYLGSEPLDPALTDRFPFIIPVPGWRELSREDQKRIILQGKADLEPENITTLNLPGLVEQCMVLIPSLQAEASEWLADYLLCVMELLDKAKLPQSPRRAATLAQNIVAIHAARMVLEGEDADLDMSAEMALLYGMPQTATEVPPAPATLVAIHKQAWEIATRLDDEAWRKVLEEADLLKRVVIAEDLNFGDEDLSRLITQALNVDPSDARKISLGTAIFLAFRKHRALTPAAWEPLAKLAGRVLQPRQTEYNVAANSPDMNLWNEIKPWVLTRRHSGGVGHLEVNYILSGFPEMWRQYNWQTALTRFQDDLKLFGVSEVD